MIVMKRIIIKQLVVVVVVMVYTAVEHGVLVAVVAVYCGSATGVNCGSN